jgi:hypothetical protein
MSHDNLDAIVNQNGFHKLIWSQPMVGWKLGWTSKQSPTSIDKTITQLSCQWMVFYLFICIFVSTMKRQLNSFTNWM